MESYGVPRPVPAWRSRRDRALDAIQQQTDLELAAGRAEWALRTDAVQLAGALAQTTVGEADGVLECARRHANGDDQKAAALGPVAALGIQMVVDAARQRRR